MRGYPTHSSLREWSWQPGWGSTCGVVQPGPPPLCPWWGGAPWTAGTCEGEGVASMSQQGESWRMRVSPTAERHRAPSVTSTLPWCYAVEDSPHVQTDNHWQAVRPAGTESDHMAQDRWAGSPVTSRGTDADRLQRYICTSARGPGGSIHSPGSWPGSRASWEWPRPTGPCLCFSCLARIRSILWVGDDSEHQVRQENTPIHPGPPDGTYCLFSWARDFSSALRW